MCWQPQHPNPEGISNTSVGTVPTHSQAWEENPETLLQFPYQAAWAQSKVISHKKPYQSTSISLSLPNVQSRLRNSFVSVQIYELLRSTIGLVSLSALRPTKTVTWVPVASLVALQYNGKHRITNKILLRQFWPLLSLKLLILGHPFR